MAKKEEKVLSTLVLKQLEHGKDFMYTAERSGEYYSCLSLAAWYLVQAVVEGELTQNEIRKYISRAVASIKEHNKLIKEKEK